MSFIRGPVEIYFNGVFLGKSPICEIRECAYFDELVEFTQADYENALKKIDPKLRNDLLNGSWEGRQE